MFRWMQINSPVFCVRVCVCACECTYVCVRVRSIENERASECIGCEVKGGEDGGEKEMCRA